VREKGSCASLAIGVSAAQKVEKQRPMLTQRQNN
jgi:hypothetical protein